MGGEFFTNQFILNHYYDLYDDSGRFTGIYICENCLNHEVWDGGPYEFSHCDNCDGTMYLHVVNKNRLNSIIERLNEERIKLRKNRFSSE